MLQLKQSPSWVEVKPDCGLVDTWETAKLNWGQSASQHQAIQARAEGGPGSGCVN